MVGADLSAKESLSSAKIIFPTVLVFGNEQKGLSDRVKRRCNALINIPGKGDMQSLNVSVAVGILLAELDRRRNSDKKYKKTK